MQEILFARKWGFMTVLFAHCHYQLQAKKELIEIWFTGENEFQGSKQGQMREEKWWKLESYLAIAILRKGGWREGSHGKCRWRVLREGENFIRGGGIGNRSSRGIFEDGNKGRRQTRNRCHLCSDLEPTATRGTWAFKYLAEWREYPHWIYEFTLTAVYQVTVL